MAVTIGARAESSEALSTEDPGNRSFPVR